MDSQQPITAPQSAQSEPTAEESSLPAWRAPVITRIDIRRTMFNGGSNIDGFGGSTPG